MSRQKCLHAWPGTTTRGSYLPAEMVLNATMAAHQSLSVPEVKSTLTFCLCYSVWWNRQQPDLQPLMSESRKELSLFTNGALMVINLNSVGNTWSCLVMSVYQSIKKWVFNNSFPPPVCEHKGSLVSWLFLNTVSAVNRAIAPFPRHSQEPI